MTTLVVGASRGLGRGIAEAIADSGQPVVALSRTEIGFDRAGIRAEVADAAEPTAAARFLKRHEPSALVLVAGATPVLGPIQEQTWETFSVAWECDVRITFQWLREVLQRPMPPGSRVIVISSGAALNGSPLSGGYAGAKATQRFLTAYAQEESDRAGLDITFTAVLPRLTPLTDLGRPAFLAYAQRAGLTEEKYLLQMGDPLTPAGAGEAVVSLLAEAAPAPAYLLTATGLRSL